MKPILVALDDSGDAEALLRAATRMARTFHAPLVLFRAVAAPPLQITPEGLPLALDADLDAEERARGQLEAYAHALPRDIQTKVATTVDVPWQGVCEAARREDASLIVIGSHGYHGPHGLIDRLLGTTAAKVVNHADRAVLVVPETGAAWLS